MNRPPAGLRLARRVAEIEPFHVMALLARARDLLEQAGVAITPGVDFGANAPERHVRFAYTNSIERLQEGVARIANFLNHA